MDKVLLPIVIPLSFAVQQQRHCSAIDLCVLSLECAQVDAG